MQASFTTIDDAPTDQTVTPPATMTVSATAPATITITFTPTPVPTDHVAYLHVSGPLSPGIANFDKHTAFLLASAASQTSPWNVSSAFSSRYGNAIPGRQYAAELRFLNTVNGALSGKLTAATIAT
jgi:hypothetical protein